MGKLFIPELFSSHPPRPNALSQLNNPTSNRVGTWIKGARLSANWTLKASKDSKAFQVAGSQAALDSLHLWHFNQDSSKPKQGHALKGSITEAVGREQQQVTWGCEKADINEDDWGAESKQVH